MGLAGLLGIVEGFCGAVGFAGFEVKAALDAVRESGEARLAVDVGADLEIELANAGEPVGDVDFDSRRIDGFAGVVGDGEVGGAGAQATIDRGDGMGIGSLGEGRGEQQQEQESSHREDIIRGVRGRGVETRRGGWTADGSAGGLEALGLEDVGSTVTE